MARLVPPRRRYEFRKGEAARLATREAWQGAKVELGRRLFYDTRLSGSGGFSCASCYRQEFGFADARNIPGGSTSEPHPRNSIGIGNAAWLALFNWADPAIPLA